MTEFQEFLVVCVVGGLIIMFAWNYFLGNR